MSSDRPNVLHVICDQLNADCLGFRGRREVRTPRIDAMARDGACFTRAYSSVAICMPSRIVYLSGSYPHTLGTYNNTNGEIPERTYSVARHARDELGYWTGIAGKAHLGRWATDGLDYRVTMSDPGRPNRYQEYLAERGLTLTGKQPGVARDYDCFITGLDYEHSSECWTGRETIKAIDQAGDKPFYIWASFHGPHGATAVSHDSPFQYDPDEITLPDYVPGEFETKPLSRRAGVENIWNVYASGEKKLRQALACYYGVISAIDDNVGRMLDHLDAIGKLDNTLVIFTADHGDFAGEHGQYGKNALGGYEPMYRVPFIWYWRGRLGGHRFTDLVETVDFAPTICELLGLPIPASVHGESLRTALVQSSVQTGIPWPWKDEVFFDTTFVKTVRTREWKLSYAFTGQECGELYDMVHDPGETLNLFDDPSVAHVRERLLRRLLDWIIRTDQPFAHSEGYVTHPDWRWYREMFPQQKPSWPTKPG